MPLSPLVPPALSPPCALEADPLGCLPSTLPSVSSAVGPQEREGESGGRVSMPGLLVFRGASGHTPGRVAPSTAPSLSLLSAPCLRVPSAPGVSPYSVLGILPWILWLPYTLHRPLDPTLFKSSTLHGPRVFCQGLAWSRHLWREAAPGPVRRRYQAQGGDPPRGHSGSKQKQGLKGCCSEPPPELTASCSNFLSSFPTFPITVFF